MSKKEKRSNKENAALQNDALSTENTENSVVQNEADAQQTDTASGSGAKISFFDADETRSGVYIDKAEAEAFLEAQRKKKLRNKIIIRFGIRCCVGCFVRLLFSTLYSAETAV